MKTVTEQFGTLYHPVKAFVVYQQDNAERSMYVESYDMSKEGYPINAHPLSLKESSELAKALDTSSELRRNFLKPSGLLPKNILFINPDHNGFAIWHTPTQCVDLLFSDSLNIPNGRATIPALLWKASKESLYVYALKGNEDPDLNSPLYHAPFFNLYEDGKVCMGTVAVNIHSDCMLEEFIHLWEQYFFNSYFSHLIQSHCPVKGNIVQLWQSLMNSRKKFPMKALIKHHLTLKNLIP